MTTKEETQPPATREAVIAWCLGGRIAFDANSARLIPPPHLWCWESIGKTRPYYYLECYGTGEVIRAEDIVERLYSHISNAKTMAEQRG